MFREPDQLRFEFWKPLQMAMAWEYGGHVTRNFIALGNDQLQLEWLRYVDSSRLSSGGLGVLEDA